MFEVSEGLAIWIASSRGGQFFRVNAESSLLTRASSGEDRAGGTRIDSRMKKFGASQRRMLNDCLAFVEKNLATVTPGFQRRSLKEKGSQKPPRLRSIVRRSRRFPQIKRRANR
jgi:hypothetical protein